MTRERPYYKPCNTCTNDYCVFMGTEDTHSICEDYKPLEQEPYREIEDYENEIEDLHNRLDIAEYDKERLREEVTNLEEKIKALEQEPCDKCVYSTKDGYCQYDDITETIPPFEPCEDAISRQAVKEQMIKYGFHAPDMTVTEFVEDLPPVTPTQKWIPVNERLPKEHLCDDGYVEPSDYVLVCGDQGDYGVSRYWGNRKSKAESPNTHKDWVDLDWVVQKPIAWMPLPEPYKAESEEV